MGENPGEINTDLVEVMSGVVVGHPEAVRLDRPRRGSRRRASARLIHHPAAAPFDVDHDSVRASRTAAGLVIVVVAVLDMAYTSAIVAFDG
jgi:hypothetical protein